MLGDDWQGGVGGGGGVGGHYYGTQGWWWGLIFGTSCGEMPPAALYLLAHNVRETQ